jgi:outer membrane murein-binding lipoprotein Lpp
MRVARRKIARGQLLTQQQELGGQITQLSGDVATARAHVTSARKQLEAATALVPESHRARATTIGASELQAAY